MYAVIRSGGKQLRVEPGQQIRVEKLAGEAGDKICRGLQAIIDDLDLPFFVYNHGSIIHLETHGVLLLDVTDPDFFAKVAQRKKIAEEIGAAYTAEGIITLAGSRLYSSMADTDEVVEEALSGFARALGSVEEVR